MKKYLLRTIAVAIAVGFSAFASKPAKRNGTPEYLFQYQFYVFSASAVADPINWLIIDDDYQGNEHSCGQASLERACELVVSSADVVDEQIAVRIPTTPGTEGRFAVAESGSGGVLYAFNELP